MTDATQETFLAHFRTLPEREIRRRQDLCQQQIALAHASQNAPALERLRTMEAALMESMMERC